MKSCRHARAWGRAVLVPLALAFGTAALSGCASPTAVSFESRGIPEAARLPDRAAVIFGWANDDRSGWSIDHVRIDDRERPEWDQESQRPTVFYLRPGLRKLRLYSSQSRGGSIGSEHRVRSRPFSISVAQGQVLLCPIRVRDEEPQRPIVACTVSDEGIDEAPPRRANAGPSESAESPQVQPDVAEVPVAEPTTPTPRPEVATQEPDRPSPSGDPSVEGDLGRQILDRLGSLEQRLDRLESLLRGAMRRNRPVADEADREPRDSRRQLNIDTTPPW